MLARFRGRASASCSSPSTSYHDGWKTWRPWNLPARTTPSSAQAELQAVGLAIASTTIRRSSGGEQQRVAIARAIVPNPAILVADEPTGNLDENTGGSIIDLLCPLKRDRGATLVLVTHDLNLARLCDRMVRLRSGQIEAGAASAVARRNLMHGTRAAKPPSDPLTDPCRSCCASPSASCAAGSRASASSSPASRSAWRHRQRLVPVPLLTEASPARAADSRRRHGLFLIQREAGAPAGPS